MVSKNDVLHDMKFYDDFDINTLEWKYILIYVDSNGQRYNYNMIIPYGMLLSSEQINEEIRRAKEDFANKIIEEMGR